VAVSVQAAAAYAAARPPLLLAAILLVALPLRLLSLGESLWLDELWSIRIILDGSGPIRLLVRDIHPPLYSLFLFAWIALFGDADGYAMSGHSGRSDREPVGCATACRAGCLAPPVHAGVESVAAPGHGAPFPRSVLRRVIEGAGAGRMGTGLEPLPGAPGRRPGGADPPASGASIKDGRRIPRSSASRAATRTASSGRPGSW
jgi:hypothetical protein